MEKNAVNFEIVIVGSSYFLFFSEVANIDPDKVYETKVNYSDDETYKIVHALASVLGELNNLLTLLMKKLNLAMTVSDTFETLGEWVMEYAFETGWDQLLHAMASNLQVCQLP